MKHWHRCERWWIEDMPCPYSTFAEHPDYTTGDPPDDVPPFAVPGGVAPERPPEPKVLLAGEKKKGGKGSGNGKGSSRILEWYTFRPNLEDIFAPGGNGGTRMPEGVPGREGPPIPSRGAPPPPMSPVPAFEPAPQRFAEAARAGVGQGYSALAGWKPTPEQINILRGLGVPQGSLVPPPTGRRLVEEQTRAAVAETATTRALHTRPEMSEEGESSMFNTLARGAAAGAGTVATIEAIRRFRSRPPTRGGFGGFHFNQQREMKLLTR